MTEDVKFKTVQTFVYPLEAHLAKTFLESEGIYSETRDELTVQIYNFYSNAIGGVKLLVKEEDYTRGIEILKKGNFIKKPGADKNPVESVYLAKGLNKSICPFCKSENISKKRVPSIWTVLVIFVFAFNAVFPVFFNKSIKCFDCGKEWRFKKRKKLTPQRKVK